MYRLGLSLFFVSMIAVNFVVNMRWDGWKICFDGGVKMFNLVTLIFGLAESIGKIRDFDLHLVTMWNYLRLEKLLWMEFVSFGVLIMVEVSMIL